MQRPGSFLSACLWVVILGCMPGCTVPLATFDNHFAAFGGAWQRGDPVAGRVGSMFQPTGETVMVQPSAEEPADPEEVAPADQSILQPSEEQPPADEDAPPDWESLLQ